MQVRLRESYFLCGHFSFLSFCIKECDVNKWVKLSVCQTRTITLCVSFYSMENSRIAIFLRFCKTNSQALPVQNCLPLPIKSAIFFLFVLLLRRAVYVQYCTWNFRWRAHKQGPTPPKSFDSQDVWERHIKTKIKCSKI